MKKLVVLILLGTCVCGCAMTAEDQQAFTAALHSYNNDKAEQIKRQDTVRPSISCTSTPRSGGRIDTDCN